jgi:hypothetical protein
MAVVVVVVVVECFISKCLQYRETRTNFCNMLPVSGKLKVTL